MVVFLGAPLTARGTHPISCCVILFADGGAEETAYGLQCLEFFLSSPSGIPTKPDLIYFNWGMHDYTETCQPGYGCVPGQSGNYSVYPGELQAIVASLLTFARSVNAKLMFGITSPMLCNKTIDDVIMTKLNTPAVAIMQAANITTVDLHAAITQKCGPAPQPACFGSAGCWCPHCPAGYEWLASTAIAPAIRAALLA